MVTSSSWVCTKAEFPYQSGLVLARVPRFQIPLTQYMSQYIEQKLSSFQHTQKICDVFNLINIWQMFNVAMDNLAVKPDISHKSLLQLCCKCLEW